MKQPFFVAPKTTSWRNNALVFGALAILPLLAVAGTDTLQEALQTQLRIQQEAVATQQQVEQLDDEQQRLLQAYQQVLQQSEQLQAQNAQLQRMIDKQNSEHSRLQQQILQLDSTRSELAPLLEQMLKVLEEFVRLDLPFLPQERQQRLQALRDAQDDPALSLADKYQRLWQAYQVEMGYGHSLESYSATLHAESATGGQLVNFLRLGRVALYYLSLDGTQAAIWDATAQQWQALAPEYRATVRTAIRITKGQANAQLLLLPLPAAQETP